MDQQESLNDLCLRRSICPIRLHLIGLGMQTSPLLEYSTVNDIYQ